MKQSDTNPSIAICCDVKIEAKQQVIDLTCFVTYWECPKCGRYTQTGIRGLEDRNSEFIIPTLQFDNILFLDAAPAPPGS